MTLAEFIKDAGLFASVVAACVTGFITRRNTTKLNQLVQDTEKFKAAVGRDLARLNATLAHGQLINSTQWNAEFEAYRSLWKAIVPVRGLAHKVRTREDDLVELGVAKADVTDKDRFDSKHALLVQFGVAVRSFMLAINEIAPFYDSAIRKAANDVHGQASKILMQLCSPFRSRSGPIDVDRQMASEGWKPRGRSRGIVSHDPAKDGKRVGPRFSCKSL